MALIGKFITSFLSPGFGSVSPENRGKPVTGRTYSRCGRKTINVKGTADPL
jgi:hypothetical protein